MTHDVPILYAPFIRPFRHNSDTRRGVTPHSLPACSVVIISITTALTNTISQRNYSTFAEAYQSTKRAGVQFDPAERRHIFCPVLEVHALPAAVVANEKSQTFLSVHLAFFNFFRIRRWENFFQNLTQNFGKTALRGVVGNERESATKTAFQTGYGVSEKFVFPLYNRPKDTRKIGVITEGNAKGSAPAGEACEGTRR